MPWVLNWFNNKLLKDKECMSKLLGDTKWKDTKDTGSQSEFKKA